MPSIHTNIFYFNTQRYITSGVKYLYSKYLIIQTKVNMEIYI